MIARGDPMGATVIDTTDQTIAATAARILDVWLNRPSGQG